jgi:hypothetical protein
VDVLIGWRLDLTLPVSVARSISNSFGNFGLLWKENLSFSLDLLDKFLSDMTAIVDAFKLSLATPAQPVPPTEQPPSVARLLSFLE